MPTHVTKIRATGVYGRFDLEQEFQPGVNIIFGKNGTGKTTFLHILANLLNADYKRFVYLAFRSVEVGLNDNTTVIIQKEDIEEDDTRITVKVDDEQLYSFLASEVSRERRFKHRNPQAGNVRLGHHLQAQLFEPSSEQEVEPLLPADYFPAFRTMIEAWASVQEEAASARSVRLQDKQIKATRLARDLFGRFVPTINYPSPLEIEQRLSREIRGAIFSVSRSDQELLSRAFLEIFTSLFSGKEMIEAPDLILDEIKSLSESLQESPVQSGFFSTPIGTYDELKRRIGLLEVRQEVEQSVIRILDVYRDTLVKRLRVQRAAYEGINNYISAVNEFLDGKKLVTYVREETSHLDNLIRIIFDDGYATGLETLSSGERQIVTLIYAATHMSEQRVVLIDEPELSLHVDWQRMLLSKMSEQLGDRQIIACTHSPVIAGDYKGHLSELTPELDPTAT